jgi:hypothetical protein
MHRGYMAGRLVNEFMDVHGNFWFDVEFTHCIYACVCKQYRRKNPDFPKDFPSDVP